MASKMAPDLLQHFTDEFHGDALKQLASVVGESPGKTQTALGSIVPAFLSSFASKASTTQGAYDVLELIRKNNLTSVGLEDLTRPNGVSNITNIGKSLLDFGLGNKVNATTDWIATHSGINRASVTSLASICGPLVLGLIGRRLGSNGLNPSSLASLLGSPGRYLHNAPAGLVSALGLGGAAATARATCSCFLIIVALKTCLSLKG